MRVVRSAGEMKRKGDDGEGRTVLREVSGLAPCARGERTRETSAATGHKWRWSERPWPMRSFRTPFF